MPRGAAPPTAVRAARPGLGVRWLPRFTCVPPSRCSAVPVLRCPGAPLSRCPAVPVPRRRAARGPRSAKWRRRGPGRAERGQQRRSPCVRAERGQPVCPGHGLALPGSLPWASPEQRPPGSAAAAPRRSLRHPPKSLPSAAEPPAVGCSVRYKLC